jgi:hypothetical protein
VNNTKDICDTFSTFFVNVANDIGKDVIFDGNSHPSILLCSGTTRASFNLVGKNTGFDSVINKCCYMLVKYRCTSM